jgi:hypothetical protein
MGRVGLEVVECLFADWWAFRRGELDRPGLQSRLDPIARELQGVLEQGCSCADSKAATFCANILAVYPALWLFAAIESSLYDASAALTWMTPDMPVPPGPPWMRQ